jgi:hypothetical protein
LLITSSGLELLHRLPGGTKLDVAAAARVVTAVTAAKLVNLVSDAIDLLHDAAIALPLLAAETTLPARTNAETVTEGIETSTTVAAPAAQLIETVTAT